MYNVYALIGSLALALTASPAWAQESLPPVPEAGAVAAQGTQEKAQEKSQPKIPAPKPGDEGTKPMTPPEAAPAPEQAATPAARPAPPKMLSLYPPASPTFVDPRTGSWRQQLLPPVVMEETGSGVPPAQRHRKKGHAQVSNGYSF